MLELRCWRRLLRVAYTAGRSNQSILKEISPGCSLEGLMLKLKLHYFGHLMWRNDWLKRPWCWDILKAEKKRTTEDKMVGRHHWLDGHEFEQTPGVGDGQGSLACCTPWGLKELDMTVWLNWTGLKIAIIESIAKSLYVLVTRRKKPEMKVRVTQLQSTRTWV